VREFSPKTRMIPQTVVLYSQDLRSQLSQERDSVRHVSLQKEIEVKDLQTRLEKSVRMNSSTHPYVTNTVLGRGAGQDTRGTRWC